MNKIATYLNEHVIGEVSSLRSIRRDYSEDGSILSITPEIVLFPAATNDIRKAARFAWQLGEKGHQLPITIRGGGTDQTGGAIGKGMIIDVSKHLNNILHVSAKSRLIHLQAGASIQTVNEVLLWHGLSIETNAPDHGSATVGGWLASSGAAGRQGLLSRINRLEVILANGDVIETGRQSRREVNRKKGLQTLEGEIYRNIDGLIEDNEELVKKLGDSPSRVGYTSIGRVKEKDGSIDLTPLFVGSQGTLGIISEVVLQADFTSKDEVIIAAILPSKELPKEIGDAVMKLDPSSFSTFDGELFAAAEALGKKYEALKDEPSAHSGLVMTIAYNDFSDRKRFHKLKKTQKLLAKHKIPYRSTMADSYEELLQIQRVGSVLQSGLTDSEHIVPIVNGSTVPLGSRSEFLFKLNELADKLHVALPLQMDLLTGAVTLYPKLHLGEVSDKQRIFRMLNEYSHLVEEAGGSFIGIEPEGRIKANAAWDLLDDQTKDLFSGIKAVFDPFKILNPDVKQPNDLKHLISSLKSSR